MRYNAAVFTALLFCLIICSLPSHAAVYSSVYANGGSIAVKSSEMTEVSNNLLRFGTSNDSYLQNGRSAAILTLGRSGIQKDDQNTKVETLGMLNAFDAAGLFSTQTHIPETICDAENFIPGENTTGQSRYPETQTAEILTGTMGSGEGTSYESQVVVNGKTIGVSSRATTPSGYLMHAARGTMLAGQDKNSSLLQYRYDRTDFSVMNSDENKTLDAGIDWLWDITADDVVNATEED